MAKDNDIFVSFIEDWVTKSEDTMLKVMKQSINDVVEDAQTVKTRGGRMPVDTGFLWHSGAAKIGSMPSGPDDKPDDAAPGSYSWADDTLISTLANMKFGDTFYWGWTAYYARLQELRNGFLEGALQNWRRIVNKNVDRLKRD